LINVHFRIIFHVGERLRCGKCISKQECLAVRPSLSFYSNASIHREQLQEHLHHQKH
jgi:hypothetical protein